MLHILWLILKFILIVFGILLGLLLLAVLLILFCPVRYRASAVKKEGGLKQIEGSGAVSWLFHGVSLKAEWKDQQLDLAFHLFGIPIDKLMKRRQERKAQKKSRTKEIEVKEKAPEIKPEVKHQDQIELTEEKQVVEQSADNLKTESSGADDSETYEQRSEEQVKETTEATAERLDKVENEPRKQASDETAEPKAFFIKKIYDRLRNILKSIQAKLRRIKKTFKRIKGQASWWKAFIGHPRVKAAGTLVWNHAKFLLKHIFPTRIEGQITFSCEDPALTGAALAILGMTIPFHKNCVQINPRFEGENCLQGNIKLKGRIYGFVFVRAALSIYFNKNIKYVIKRWKTRRA